MPTPTAHDPWFPAAEVAEVPAERLKGVYLAGRRIVVVRHGEAFFALWAECPHQGASLAEGCLVGAEIACAVHQFRYDLETGRATRPADHSGLHVYPTRVTNGRVEVQVHQTPHRRLVV